MTNLEDARVAVAAGADAIGFVFARSPRQVTPEQARSIVAGLPTEVEKVGVFLNEDPTRIRDIADTVGLTVVQLQGDETIAVAEALRRGGRVRSARRRIFKTVPVVTGAESALRRFANCEAIDALLLDSVVTPANPGAEPIRGGTGVPFDWKRASRFMPGLCRRKRIIVAGGLAPETVASAIRMLQPWGVDVCSGVESEPGRKDHDKVRAFVHAVRSVH